MPKSADAFRTISEVAEWLDTPAHVLRFWESKFSQIKPVKRAGGRRYYRPADMMLVGGIKKLLHDDGLTIKGAQKVLREQGVKHVIALSIALEEDEPDNIQSADDLEPLPHNDLFEEVIEAPTDTASEGLYSTPEEMAPAEPTVVPFHREEVAPVAADPTEAADTNMESADFAALPDTSVAEAVDNLAPNAITDAAPETYVMQEASESALLPDDNVVNTAPINTAPINATPPIEKTIPSPVAPLVEEPVIDTGIEEAEASDIEDTISPAFETPTPDAPAEISCDTPDNSAAEFELAQEQPSAPPSVETPVSKAQPEQIAPVSFPSEPAIDDAAADEATHNVAEDAAPVFSFHHTTEPPVNASLDENTDATPVTTPQNIADDQPSLETLEEAPVTPPEPEVIVAPRPNIVAVPDDPSDTDIITQTDQDPVQNLLSLAAQNHRALTPDQINALAPLVEQLKALKTRMMAPHID